MFQKALLLISERRKECCQGYKDDGLKEKKNGFKACQRKNLFSSFGLLISAREK
jgi:hypothetical protein